MTPSVRHCEERSDEAIQSAPEGKAGLLRFARNDGKRDNFLRRLADAAVFTLIAIFAAAASWFAYWIAFALIFAPNVHPDYWPAGPISAILGLAAITGIAAALLFFRMSSGRSRR